MRCESLTNALPMYTILLVSEYVAAVNDAGKGWIPPTTKCTEGEDPSDEPHEPASWK